MDFEQYKNIWNEHDKKLDKHIKLNMKLISKLNLDKTRSELNDFLRTPLYGLLIGLVLQVFLIFFMNNHLDSIKFLIPAILINIYVVLQIVVSFYQVINIRQITYDSPVLDIQRKLGTLNFNRIRYLTTTRFSYPLLWVPVILVSSKAIFNLDLYLHLEQWWIWIQISIGIVFLIFGLWLSQQYATQRITSTILTRLMNSITKSDITGKNLVYAINFLDDIGKFQQEA